MDQLDPYRKWLGIPLEEQPPHHYRLLGIGLFEDDPDVVEAAADRQMSHVQTYKTGKHSALSQRILNELAAAKLCLLNKAKKAAYDESLRARIAAQAPQIPVAVPVAPPVVSEYQPPYPAYPAAVPAVVAPPVDPAFLASPGFSTANQGPVYMAPSTVYGGYRRKRQQAQPWKLALGLVAALAVAALALGWWAYNNGRRDVPTSDPGRPNEVEKPIEPPQVADKSSDEAPPKFAPPEPETPPSPIDAKPVVKPKFRELMEVANLNRHEGPVLSLALARANALLITGGQDGTARIWNTQSHTELHLLRRHEGPVRAAAISPNGQFALTAGDDERLHQWNLRNGKHVKEIRIAVPKPVAVAYTPSGKYAYVGGQDTQLVRYDLSTGQEASRESPLPGNVTDLAMNAGGTILACATDEGTLRLIRFNSNDEVLRHTTGTSDYKHPDGAAGRTTCLAFSGDGRYLLLGNVDKAAHLFDLAKNGETAMFIGHEETINAVAFSQDSRFAVTGSGDATPTLGAAKPATRDFSVRLWDVATGRELARYTGHEAPVRHAVLLIGVRNGFSCSDDGTIRLWRQEPKNQPAD